MTDRELIDRLKWAMTLGRLTPLDYDAVKQAVARLDALNRELVEYHELEVYSAARRSGEWFVIDHQPRALAAALKLVEAGLWEEHPDPHPALKRAFRPLTAPGEGER